MPIVYKERNPHWIKDAKSTLTQEAAKKQDIRPLRIGIINYMPDAALKATEQDFLRPLIEASGSHQFETTFFSPESIERSRETQEYLIKHYINVTRESLAQCDMLIHTGGNDLMPDGTGIDFKEDPVAKEILKNYQLANDAGVTTQIASCLASQVIAHNKYNIPISSNISRDKVTGVFPHRTTEKGKKNYITQGLVDQFPVVYSRNHSLESEAIERHPQLNALIQNIPNEKYFDSQNETHLFIDPKNLFFGFQGHPEYQKEAIYKEFLRDVGLYFKTPEIYKKFPTIPPNYFSEKGFEKVQKFQEETETAVAKKMKGEKNVSRPQLEIDIDDEIIQSWRDTADKIWARIFNATYQLTGFEPGEKLTKKRDIVMQEFPLEALV